MGVILKKKKRKKQKRKKKKKTKINKADCTTVVIAGPKMKEKERRTEM